jgi:hypothetical protein
MVMQVSILQQRKFASQRIRELISPGLVGQFKA